mgnify:CR=1 FL=1
MIFESESVNENQQKTYLVRVNLGVEALDKIGLIGCPEQMINSMITLKLEKIPFDFSEEPISEENPAMYIQRRVVEITRLKELLSLIGEGNSVEEAVTLTENINDRVIHKMYATVKRKPNPADIEHPPKTIKKVSSQTSKTQENQIPRTPPTNDQLIKALTMERELRRKAEEKVLNLEKRLTEMENKIVNIHEEFEREKEIRIQAEEEITRLL